MFRDFLLPKVGMAAITIFATSAVVFGALYLAPGDPVTFLTKGRPADPATIAAITQQYHLNDPLITRYQLWVSGVLHGDLGQSIMFRQDVTTLVGSRMPTTLWLVAMASVLIVTVGIGVGLFSALRPGKLDDSLMLGATLAAAVPIFVIAIALVSFFSIRLGWFPTFGSGESGGFLDRLKHLTLPAVALAFAAVAFVARITRASLREEMDKEHVRAARSRGLASSDVVRRHVVRNGFAPIVTVTGLTIAGLFVGTAIIEKAFALNGIGGLLIDAVSAGDFPVVQAIALLMVIVFILTNLGTDLLQHYLDPRQRRAVKE